MSRIGIVGAGAMGSGIAQVCAAGGHDVALVDVDTVRVEQSLAAIGRRLDREVERGHLTAEAREATVGRLRAAATLADLASSDIVIEAVVENLAVKQGVFAELGRVCRPDAILASNTSVLSISALAAASGRPQQVIGLHFFNPPYALKLVEIVPSAATSAEVVEAAQAFCATIDRVAVLAKDTPGFVVNRLVVPFLLDAIRLFESGAASAEDVDAACKAGLGHTMGPLATADLVGLDTLLAISEALFEELGEPRFKAPVGLRRLVSLGRLGRKSGSGFFTYS
jgi:3-hydroxybutyryl-CoA dehydrogenase